MSASVSRQSEILAAYRAFCACPCEVTARRLANLLKGVKS